MKFIGLLMLSHEDDILMPVLVSHALIVDAFYVLDGTRPNAYSRRTCETFIQCASYTHDSEYEGRVVDGARQLLYEQAVADHGYDNWFLILHGDEVWSTDPRVVVAENPGADSFVFPLPCYFPRASEGWDKALPPLAQLRWHLRPGWPELRMFMGAPGVSFDPDQHFNVTPRGLSSMRRVEYPIRHYLYRSPAVQRERARRHLQTGFDPDNYRHIIERDEVLWTDEMIASWQQQACWAELVRD